MENHRYKEPILFHDFSKIQANWYVGFSIIFELQLSRNVCPCHLSGVPHIHPQIFLQILGEFHFFQANGCQDQRGHEIRTHPMIQLEMVGLAKMSHDVATFLVISKTKGLCSMQRKEYQES